MPNSARRARICSIALFATARKGLWIGKPVGDFSMTP